MPYTVITGANSGIANAWSKILLSEEHNVLACDIKHGDGMDALLKLGATTMILDVTNPVGIAQLKEAIADVAVDNLLNVAGIMARQDNDTLGTCNLAVLQQTFAVNTYGPFLLVQALLPNLQRSANAKIGMVSSRVGSISDNASGGSYAYRASKAALNSLSKSLSIDLKDKNIPVVVLHPGLVKTNIDPKNWEIEEAVNPEEAAEKLWKVYQSKGIEETGKFWHREGQELPW